MMNRYLGYILAGYVMGGFLFASWIPKVFCRKDIVENSDDGNPGTFNAFSQCGIPIGMLVLICELGKAFIPVYAASHNLGMEDRMFALVMLAPVFGHICPILHHGRGGKGIATSFGVMLALSPELRPFATLALCYILFSTALRIETHLWRSVVTYAVFAVLACSSFSVEAIRIGSVLIAGAVIVKHLIKRTEDEGFSVRILWRHAG